MLPCSCSAGPLESHLSLAPWMVPCRRNNRGILPTWSDHRITTNLKIRQHTRVRNPGLFWFTHILATYNIDVSVPAVTYAMTAADISFFGRLVRGIPWLTNLALSYVEDAATSKFSFLLFFCNVHCFGTNRYILASQYSTPCRANFLFLTHLRTHNPWTLPSGDRTSQEKPLPRRIPIFFQTPRTTVTDPMHHQSTVWTAHTTVSHQDQGGAATK